MKKYGIYWVWYYLKFQASTRGFGTYSPWITRDYCTHTFYEEFFLKL